MTKRIPKPERVSRTSRMVEEHPWPPFYPPQARILLLGSFPPPAGRWSMPFYYPNWQNDMWRIFGEIFFKNRHYFELSNGHKGFDQERLTDFLTHHRIALSDVGRKVIRKQGNASDLFLEIVEALDPVRELTILSECTCLVTTGQRASESLRSALEQGFGHNDSGQAFSVPEMEHSVEWSFNGRTVFWYRMPSSSRAYPKPFSEKVAAYRALFERISL